MGAIPLAVRCWCVVSDLLILREGLLMVVGEYLMFVLYWDPLKYPLDC